MIKSNSIVKFISIFLTVILLFVSNQAPSKADSTNYYDEAKTFLTKEEENLWRYKMNKISILIDANSWYIVQGVNTQITDTEFLRLAGNTDLIKDRLKTFDIREPIGIIFAVMGIIAIVGSGLILTNIIKVPDNNSLLYGSLGVVGGVSFVLLGDAISPLGTMEISEHILTIEEARYITELYNADLRKSLNITSE